MAETRTPVATLASRAAQAVADSNSPQTVAELLRPLRQRCAENPNLFEERQRLWSTFSTELEFSKRRPYGPQTAARLKEAGRVYIEEIFSLVRDMDASRARSDAILRAIKPAAR